MKCLQIQTCFLTILFKVAEIFIIMADIENEQIKTMKEFMANYNKLSEVCFSDCIWDFTSRKISGVENQCALYCTEKYLKMNQRISTRFQEFQMISNENAMAVIKKSGQL